MMQGMAQLKLPLIRKLPVSKDEPPGTWGPTMGVHSTTSTKDIRDVHELNEIVSPNELLVSKVAGLPNTPDISEPEPEQGGGGGGGMDGGGGHGKPLTSPLPSLVAIPTHSSKSLIHIPGHTDEQKPASSDESSGDEKEKPVKKAPSRFMKIGLALGKNKTASQEKVKKDSIEDLGDDDKAGDLFVADTSINKDKLLFDKNAFKCDRRTYGGLTARARKIFMRPTRLRTEEDLVHLYEVVDRLMCFRRYSKKIKHRLASVITFDAYDNGRRIIKEGQPGRSLYFIVTGGAIVMTTVVHKKTGKRVPQVLAELYEGSCFGELALLHNVKRTASIISKGKSEFLRVDKEDFEAVLRHCYEEDWHERMVAISCIPQFHSWSEFMINEVNRASRLKEFPGHVMVYGNVVNPKPDELYFMVKGDCHVVRAINLYCRTTLFGRKTYHVAESPIVQEALSVTRDKGERRRALHTNEVWSVQRRYWSIGAITKGFYFAVGEDFRSTYVVTRSRSEFLVVPRVHFVRAGQTKILDKMRDDLNRVLPNDATLLRRFHKEVAWEMYKKDCVEEVISRNKVPRTTLLEDVPQAIRLDKGLPN